MKTINTWSFSRLQDYESCPYKAWLKHAERIPDPKPNKYADRGTAIHTLAEEYLLGKIDPIPLELMKFHDDFKSLRTRSDKLMLEQEWGFNRNWEPCEYRGTDTWGRVKLDCALGLTDTEGVVIDFKTGKKFGNEIKHGEQLQVYALSSFIRHPDWKTLTAELWYLDQDDMTSITVTRKTAMERYLKVYDGRFRKMTDATEFSPKPNIISCKYCPYGDTGHCDKRVVDEQATKNFYQRMHAKKD